MLLQRQLNEDVDLLLFDPIRARGLDARPGPAATAVDFAALQREIDVIAAGIAGDDLHLGAEHVVENARELIRIGRRAGSAHRQLLGVELLELRDITRLVPGYADADLIIGAADPGELVAVELRLLVSEQRIEASAAADGAEHRAVLGRDVVEPVSEAEAAGALHVLRRHRRIAGDVLAHVTRDQPGIDVIAAAHAVADHEIDVLAFIK